MITSELRLACTHKIRRVVMEYRLQDNDRFDLTNKPIGILQRNPNGWLAHNEITPARIVLVDVLLWLKHNSKQYQMFATRKETV